MHALVAAVASVALALSAPAPTTSSIGVFADQLPDGMPPTLLRFAATHYDGAQKLGRTTTLALKRQNQHFFALQYRLALGLGRTTQVRFGDAWQREWPARPRERWFFHVGGRRVLNKTWGWYLMNVDDGGWRSYYVAKLHQQIRTTAADGAFLDSASMPSYFGAVWTPPLPAVDPVFEAGWSKRITRWLPTVQRRLGVPVVANAGSWVTARDRTDYSGVAGVMIEGFATSLGPADWQRELTRALSLVRKGKILIAQSYPDAGDVQARMFDLASYLLIKGAHTYVNFPQGIEVDWFPEYGIDLGAAVDPAGLRQQDGAYVRRFAKGLVAVNPGDAPVTVQLDGTYESIVPHGGGRVPDSAALPADWGLAETPVTGTLTLGPHQGAVLLH